MKSSSTTTKTELSIPKGIAVKRESGHLLIVRRWFHPRWIVFIFMGLILIFIGAVTLPKALPALNTIERIGIFLPFLTPIVLFYIGLCNLFNRTEIRLNGTRLDIRHIPLPLLKSTRVDTTLVDQWYSVRQYTNPNSPPAYAIEAVLKSEGKRKRLIPSIDNEAQALYILNEIRQYIDTC